MAGLSVDNVLALRQSILQRNAALKDASSSTAATGAGAAPGNAGSADFTGKVWPTNMQQALLGQITPDAMMQAFEALFNG